MKRLSTLLLALMLLFTLSACGDAVTYDALGLAQVKDGNHLEDLIETDNLSFFDSLFGRRDSVDENTALDGAPESGAEDIPEHSETNVQVEGIDEGDIVKTDGERIYYVRGDKLTVIAIGSDGSMETVHDEKKDEGLYGRYSELYITDGKLVAIGSFYEIQEDDDTSKDSDTMEDAIYFPAYITRSTIDIYDLDTMNLEDTFEVSGHLTNSRLIGDTVYLLSTHRANRDADDPRPTFKVNGDTLTPDYEEIKYLPEMPTRMFTVISTIKLEDDAVFEYDIFLGVHGWGQLYVSQTAIYMATNYTPTTDTDRDSDTAVDSSAHAYGRIITYRFTEDGSVEYGGSGEYVGWILNQFSMDEHEETFRIVTTDGWGDDIVNRLFIFERAFDDDGQPYMREVARIDEGIGKPRETIRSARFDGDILTVVTFEQTDPYYVIDLSDPENPVIEGELEMPGFSTYQHPWKDDTVIGVGYETDEEGRTIGLKLSLYDISDRENPAEIGESLVLFNEDSGWQYGEALHNHKAILVSETRDFIGFAINSNQWSGTYEHSSDYLIFGIDASRDTPVEIDASISHIDLFTDNDDANAYLYSVNRAVTIGDSLYVLSNGAITRHDMTDEFERIESILFAGE